MSFSYPNQYVAVWIIILFSLSTILRNNTFLIKSNIIVFSLRIFIALGFCIALVFTLQNIKNELLWKETATCALEGFTEDMLPEFHRLYFTRLKKDPLFLYNYGAELHYAGNYDSSNKILNKCTNKFNDYDLQLLFAINYLRLKDYPKAEAKFKLASDMIPNRFYPLYQLVKLYQITGQKHRAKNLANDLLEKPIKIPSTTIDAIKQEMKEYTKQQDNE